MDFKRETQECTRMQKFEQKKSNFYSASPKTVKWEIAHINDHDAVHNLAISPVQTAYRLCTLEKI